MMPYLRNFPTDMSPQIVIVFIKSATIRVFHKIMKIKLHLEPKSGTETVSAGNF